MKHIAGTAVKDFFESKFLLWCTFHAPPSEKDPESEYMNLLVSRGLEHEKKIVQDLYPNSKSIEATTPEQMLKELKMGHEAIHNISLFLEDLIGVPDLLVKEKGTSALGDFHYLVKEIKSAKHIKKKHVMQTVFYNFILGQVQAFTPEKVYIINKEGLEKVYLYKEYEPELLEALEEIRDIIKGERIEPAINTPYPWKKYAEKLARKNKDITLIQGVTERVREGLLAAGIKTIRDVLETPEEKLTAVDKIGDATAQKIKRSAQAWARGKPVIFGKPKLREAKVEIFFDFESTTPDENLGVTETANYLFGMLIREEKETFLPIIAHSLKEEEKALREFLKVIEKYHDTVIYVYSDYELKQFKRMFEQYAIPEKMQVKVLANIVDLLKVVKHTVVFPTINNGLKEVAKYLGHKWRHDDVTGQESMAMYLEYLETKDKALLQKIIDYNEDDVQATKIVKDWLARSGKK